MQHINLGNTNLKVSEFCLGILPMGPLQADLPEEDCISLIDKALDFDVNFLDTAEMYKTQKYVGKAIKHRRNDVVIATKSGAKTYDDMAKSVAKSLHELNTDYIDIYHLHAARVTDRVFEERKGALKYLTEMKEKGVIKAIGISTHGIKAVKKAAETEKIDVVYPLINKEGLGLHEGNTREMLDAIKECYQAGKGLYAMKVLAGGNLINELEESLNWARNIDEIHAISLGITSLAELKYNLHLFGQEDIEINEIPDTTRSKQLYIFKNICRGCESCIEMCPNEALSMIDEKANVDHDKCILCGYCAPHCPYLAIRVI